MPQAEFDLLNAQLGLSFDPLLSYDFATSSYPLSLNANVTTEYNLDPGFSNGSLSHRQPVPGPSRRQQQVTPDLRTSPSGRLWNNDRHDDAAHQQIRVDLDEDAGSDDQADVTGYDPFDDPIYLRLVTLEQAEKMYNS